jgi:hypothetical protein
VSSFFAWLLGFALRNWHLTLDAFVALFVAIVWFFRGPTALEVALVAFLVAHHFDDWFEAAGSWVKAKLVALLAPIPEDAE